MTARQNSTQQKAIVKANNERWAASKNGTTIRVYEDGTVSYGDGTPLTWAEAHKLVTDGRKHFQAERKDRNGAKKAERVENRRKKLQAKIDGIVTGLVATGMSEADARALLANGAAA